MLMPFSDRRPSLATHAALVAAVMIALLAWVRPAVASGPAGPTWWVDFSAIEDGDGTRESPFNSLRRFMFPQATLEDEGFQGLPIGAGTTLRLRGRGDPVTASLSITRADNVAILPWDDNEPWEIAGFVDISPQGRYTWKSAAQRGDPYSNVYSVRLGSLVDEFLITRGHVNAFVTAVARGYAPELPGPVTSQPWAPGVAYRVGDAVTVPGAPEGIILRCRTTGVSGPTPPKASAKLGSIVTGDGSVTWDLHHAAIHTVTARDVFIPLIEQGGLPALAAAGVGYIYDQAGRVLHIATPSGDAPGTGAEPAWQVRVSPTENPRRGVSTAEPGLLQFLNCDGVRIEGGRLLWSIGPAIFSHPRTLSITECDGVLVRNLFVAYSGDDSIAVVQGSPTDITIEDCVIINPGEDSGVVLFTKFAFNFIRGARVRNVDVHQTRAILYGGETTLLNRGRNAASFATHGDGSGTPVADVEFVRCRSIGYGRDRTDRTTMPGFSPRDALFTPEVPADASAWPLRFVECQALLSGRMPFLAGSFSRCLLHTVAETQELATVISPGALLESTVLWGDEPIAGQMFHFTNGSLYMRNALAAAPLQTFAGVFAFPFQSSEAAFLDRAVVLATDPNVTTVALSGEVDTRRNPYGGRLGDFSGGTTFSLWTSGVTNFRTALIPGARGLSAATDGVVPLGVAPGLPDADRGVEPSTFYQAYPSATMLDGPTGVPDPLRLALGLDAFPGAAPIRSVRAGAENGLVGLNGEPSSGLWGPYQFGAARACNAADLAAPLGILDKQDVLAFIDAHAWRQPAADLAPAWGVFDVSDMIAFCDLFRGPCAAPSAAKPAEPVPPTPRRLASPGPKP